MNTLAKAKHLHELVKLNSGATTDEFFKELLSKNDDERLFKVMQFAYWRSCKISGVKPMKIEWMQDFYNEMLEREKQEEHLGI